MERKVVSGMILTIFLINTLMLACGIQSVKAEGPIYIRTDGSVEPHTAPIQRDGNLYTFTDNVHDSIVVERGNVIIDGNGYVLQGTEAFASAGIYLFGVNNVTIRNTNIRGFYYGVYLCSTSHNVLSENNVTSNRWYGIFVIYSLNNNIFANNITNNIVGGISLGDSSYNNIYANNIEENHGYGIEVNLSFNNNISGNNITTSQTGILLYNKSSSNSISGNNITTNKWGIGIWLRVYSNYNKISGNNITDNGWGIFLEWCSNFNSISGNNIEANYFAGMGIDGSSNNFIYHNDFVKNLRQIYTCYWSTNLWDDGYPSGGNYWSDYSEIYPTVKDEKRGKNQHISGSDGIWDHPYVIDANNQDKYPLVRPWTPSPVEEAIQELIETIETWNLPKGTENCLTSKLDDAIHLVNKGNENGATHKLMDLIDQAEALRNKKLTSEQADNLIAEAQRIINLIEG